MSAVSQSQKDSAQALATSVDILAPTLVAATPLDKATAVAVSNDLTFEFSEAIVKGTGAITLKTSVGTLVEEYDLATSSNVTVSGNKLTINPTTDFVLNTRYSLEFEPNSVLDLAGNGFIGNTTYGFSTGVPVAGKNINGSSGKDTVAGDYGDDIIDGGSGIDTFVSSQARSSYQLTKTASGWTLNSATDGLDALTNIERLKFSDGAVALDTDGIGGQAYRIYQAAFNRTPDLGGLGFWISVMDGGASLKGVAGGFVESAEFKAVYGANPTNAEIVTRLYDNVLHRPGESGGYNFWLGILDRRDGTEAEVLAAFSESAENQAGVIGVIGNGFEFTPFG